jgi:hypothetical protein
MTNQYKSTGVSTLLFLLLLLCVACHNYYKVTSARSGTAAETAGSIDTLHNQNRYFILRNGNTAYAMRGYLLSDDKKTLLCDLEQLPLQHQLHLGSGIKGKKQYKRNDIYSLQVLKEVHFYIPYDTAAREGRYSLSLDRVQKIEVIEHDRKRTTNSYVLGALGYTVGAVVLVGIIVAATKSSCPFVSAYDGNEFILQGEVYGGSIYPQLARHDYMPLKMAPMKNGTVQLKISNELQERQFTDIADLLVVTHDKNTRVLVDEQGAFYTVTDPQTPFNAILNNNKDVLRAVTQRGDHELLYMDDSSGDDARNEVTLKFNKVPGSSSGKLILNLKNSYWLDLLYGKLANGFGTYYASYMKEQRTKPAADLLKWTKEQQIPLQIALKTEGEWKDVTSLTTIGPLAAREIVVPVDLSQTNSDLIEIKLSSGFMFWEIDYAAMDFTSNNEFTVQKLSPQKATDEQGKNVLQVLLKEDGLYLEQPEIGNVATIEYKPRLNPSAEKTHSYFLHAKGYYEHIRDFKNQPDLIFLSQFKKPNAFPVYGMKLYQQIKSESLQSLTAKN